MTDRHAPDRHAFDHHDDRELDALLNEALTSYVDQGPDPLLRTRIFARMDEAAPPLRRMWHIGSLAAAACVVALLLAFLLHHANRAPEDRTSKAPAMASAAPPPPAASAKRDHTLTDSAHPRVVAASRHSDHSRKPIPSRRNISLASAPLTEEEITLLRFAQQHPEQAREVLSPPPSGPIHIDPVIISPIQIADLSASQPDAH
jgi:hypothetical protein